jgi:hypothetical protein
MGVIGGSSEADTANSVGLAGSRIWMELIGMGRPELRRPRIAEDGLPDSASFDGDEPRDTGLKVGDEGIPEGGGAECSERTRCGRGDAI